MPGGLALQRDRGKMRLLAMSLAGGMSGVMALTAIACPAAITYATAT